ncbi:MAG: NAD(P)-binding protein [Gammaproteobacteria bacterium]|nr:NAD(P)-binding protein [Gammaproteobacteria bacterium]
MTTNNLYDVVICGGGFRGAMCAIHLAKSGAKVKLIEASPRLGGVLNSIPWKHYHLDIGCHLFDNSSKEITELFFDIHSDVHPVTVSYQSVMATDKVAFDMAQPDLTLVSVDPSKTQDTLETAIHQKPTAQATDYHQYLTARFGSYITQFLAPCVKKKSGAEPDQLCASASGVILMDRVKLFDDNLTTFLKKTPEFDDRLALPSSNNQMIHYPEAASFYNHRNFYPCEEGMGGFCRSLETYLSELGVDITYQNTVRELQTDQLVLTSGEIVHGNKFIWSNELFSFEELAYNSITLKTLSHPVAAVLVYFEVPMCSVSDTTYLQDYRNNTPSFRLSTAGKYGNQNVRGNTYICCEIFTHEGSDNWQISESNYSEVWSQARELGIVDCARPLDVKTIKHPCAYYLPKIGNVEQKKKLVDRFKRDHPNWLFFEEPGFSKQSIYLQAKEIAALC